jgi:nucleotide-binding universal stress UspA family protein
MTSFARSALTESAQGEAKVLRPTQNREGLVVPLFPAPMTVETEPSGTTVVQTQPLLSSDGAFSDIVVAVDDRPSDQRALATAARLALRLGTALHLVSVHRRNGSGAEYSWRRTILDDNRRSLIIRYPDIEGHVDTHVVVDDTSVCPLCEAYPRAITVTATDRIAGATGEVARFTADKLASQAHHHPTVVVGPRVDDEWPPGPIAVALNGSPLVGSALDAAARWATALHVDLELLEVLNSADSALSDAGSRQYLRAARRRVENDVLRVHCRTVVNDDTGRVIARFLRKRDCSLAVMATQRVHGIERRAVARLTMNLIAQSPCPVLLCA